MVATNEMAELALREMILGVLKSKVKSGSSIVHSSDFRSSITDLGFSLGSPIIEDILIHCKLDVSGNLDFSELEKHLARERKITNSKPKPPKSAVQSSVGVSLKPWRADDVHNAKVSAEKQAMKVNENYAEIKSLFTALALHEMNSTDVLNAIAAMDIHCTNSFVKTVQTMEYSDVSFSEFVRSLTVYNTDQSCLSSQDVAAGGYSRKPEDLGEQIGLRRKRASGNARDIVFHESALSEDPQRRLKKQIAQATNINSRKFSSNDKRMFKSSAVRDILMEEESDRNSSATSIPLLSHAQMDMAVGRLGNGASYVDNLKYNVELKLQREQVLAALRRLDAGDLSLEDFQDVLFSIGVDLPEAMHAKLSREVTAGQIDLREFIKLLDASLFKTQALENTIGSSTSELVDQLRSCLIAAHRGHPLVFTKLMEVFKTMDEDCDGHLTFQEFLDSIRAMGLSTNNSDVTEETLRLIFHNFDRRGHGLIDVSTFYTAIVQRTDSVIDGARTDVVRQAFDALTRSTGGRLLSIENLMDGMNIAEHPAIVCDCTISEKECISNMLRFFDYYAAVHSANHSEPDTASHQADGISFGAFEAYFQALSAGIDGVSRSGDLLVSSMRKCFGLSETKAPPPALLALKKGYMATKNNALTSGSSTDNVLVTPRALQHHGDCIAWRQEDSGVLESEERLAAQNRGRKVFTQSLTRNFNTDVINWKRREDNVGSPKKSQSRELRAMGMASITAKPKKNISMATKQVLTWSSGSATPTPATLNIQHTKVPTNEDAIPAAGISTLPTSSPDEKSKRRLTGKSLEDFYLRPKPFGTDDNNNFISSKVPGVGKPRPESFGSGTFLSNIYNMNPPSRSEPESPVAVGSTKHSTLREAIQSRTQKPTTLGAYAATK